MKEIYYGVYDENDELVAIHDDKKIAKKYSATGNYYVVKLKKKQIAKLEEDGELQEYYLIRYGHEYVPYILYETIKDSTEQIEYDLQYCIDILFRVIEDNNRSDEDNNIILRTISILKDELNQPTLSLTQLKELKELDDLYTNKTM